MNDALEFRLTKIRKRDGSLVDFDKSRIANAIYRAMEAARERTEELEGDLEVDPQRIADNVVIDLRTRVSRNEEGYIPGIEDIQDLVQKNLILDRKPETAIGYINYRQKRSEIRHKGKNVPERVRNLIDESKQYFKNNSLGEFTYFRSYSRWMDNEGRRETWIETVDRYIDFMKKSLEDKLTEDEYGKVKHSILNHEALPSMRLLWSAGSAAESSNVTAYNCAFTGIQDLKDFGENLYVLMCGTGMGYSVENKSIQQLPIIKPQRGETAPTHVVKDSKEGWADAFVHGMQTWYDGYDIDFDFSKVRPAGARLKTMGGRSSGPAALRVLLEYSKEKILKNQGRRLNSLDSHDILCKTGEIVVVGGVRRSAEISLSDLDDELMRYAKTRESYGTHPERSMANNSSVYDHKPSNIEFMKEFLALAESGTGERGIFNREGLKYQLPERRLNVLGDWFDSMGTNPCGEIYLRSKQFCNLTEIVARAYDTLGSLREKVEIATLLGTYQATLTNFPYLSPQWKENCEEERLLGVSITGIMDAPILKNPKVLRDLREHSIEVNQYYAQRFGIAPSTCITCVKPSGTASKIVHASPGGHARWSDKYQQNIRISANDPLFQMMKDQKYPYYPEVGQGMENATTFVLPFAVESPTGSITRHQLNSIDQLENWLRLKENYTEHNPSVSIYVGDNEWLDTAQWVYKHWDSVGGLAFFPKEDHVYKLAPYTELNDEGYQKLKSSLPEIDYARIIHYEQEDLTSGAREYACVGGKCDI